MRFQKRGCLHEKARLPRPPKVFREDGDADFARPSEKNYAGRGVAIEGADEFVLILKFMAKINIGDRWATVVKSASTNKELFNVYEKNLPFVSRLFIDNIRNRTGSIEVADFGGGIGSLTDKIKKDHSKKIKIFCTCLDSHDKLLKLNKSADSKVCIDIRKPLGNEKYDIGLMRYVLNYNNKSDQLKILKNIHKALKSNGVFINWWCGVSNPEHQKKFQDLFGTKKINELLYRPSSYWTTWNENKELFEKAGFNIKVAKVYQIPIRYLYKVRYKLTDTENEKILKFLGKYKFINYVIFTADKK